MRNNVFFSLLFIFCSHLINISYAQDKTTFLLKDTIFAVQYFQTGDSLLNAAEYDSSLYNFQKAKEIYEQINQQVKSKLITEKKLQCDNKAGWVLMRQGKLDSAMQLGIKTLEEGIKELSEDHLEVAQSYHVIGVVHWAKSDYQESLKYHRKSLAIKLKLLGEYNAYVASSYNNIGIAYDELGDYDKALEYYQKTLETDINIGEKDEIRSAKTYNNIGNTYSKKGDHNKALEYHEKAYSIRLKHLGEDDPYTAGSITHIGISYANKEDYPTALEYFKKALEIELKVFGEEHRIVGKSYNNIGNCYYYLGEYDKALQHCLKSLKIKERTLGEQNFNLITDYINLGKIYKDKGEYDTAIEKLNIAVSIGTASIGEKHPDVAIGYLRLAQVYELKRDYQSALRYCQKSIISLVKNFNNDNITVNPELEKINSEVELLNTLILKAGIFSKLTDISNLQISLNTYQLASELIDRMRTGYKAEGSKLFLGEYAGKVYDQAVQTSLRLYKITNKEDYKHQAFFFAEKSKAAVLQEGLADVKAKQYAGIPPAVLEEEKQIKTDLVFYETQLQNEYFKNIKDSARIAEYETLLFDLKQKYEDLTYRLEKDYPDYHALKYQTKTVTIPEIMEQIPFNTTLVEYFIGDSVINIFTVSSEEFEITQVDKPDNLPELIREFYTSILKTETKKYISSSNELSRLLISGIMPKINNQGKIIIIPHDILYKIPFEALFTEDQKKNTGYSDFNYLVKNFDISYHYSSTLYINNIKKKVGRFVHSFTRNKSFIGFAPVFPDKDPGGFTLASLVNQHDDPDGVIRSVTADGKKLNELKYSEWEVKSIIDLFSKNTAQSLAYFYSDATEENFKLSVKNHSIIHIATHSFINENYPQLSGIIFAQPEDSASSDDGILYPGEIYNLDLTADLVVLSSCESGLGKLIKGEGMMALTRGLLYSGASNIIFSLWKIPDKHTSELMIEFYKSAVEDSSERSYAGSLRDAKLALINNPSTARPRSWASFLLVGSE